MTRAPETAAPPPDGRRRMFVHDLVLSCSIGVHRHERDASQRVRLNIDLAVADDSAGLSGRLADTVDYENIVERARSIAGARHYTLVETLAEALAAMCLADPRVHTARIRVEKPDVFADTGAVGVEIERPRRTGPNG